jgi:hypothetical protein
MHVRVHDVGVRDRRLLRDIINAKLVRRVVEQIHDRLCPIRAVSEQPKVTERLLRAAKLALFLAQLVGEFD